MAVVTIGCWWSRTTRRSARRCTSSLRAHGHEVRWERDRAARRSAAAAAQAFDLVLLDLGLPDLDGVEVCRRLRAAQPGTVIVMLTARADEMDVVVGLEAGADDYLTKPFRLAELLARVRAHLRRGAPRRRRRHDRARSGDLRRRHGRAGGCTVAGTEVAAAGQGVRPAGPAGGGARRRRSAGRR